MTSGGQNDKQKRHPPAHHPLPPPKEGNRKGIKGELFYIPVQRGQGEGLFGFEDPEAGGAPAFDVGVETFGFHELAEN